MMTVTKTEASWRVKVGSVIFVASLAWPVLLPVLPLLGASGADVAAFAGVMAVAAELMLLAGAAIAGKDGFAFIKSRVFGFLKSFGPPKTVGRTRYAIGLAIFAVPVLYGWASPYVGHHVPGYDEHPLALAITGDVLLLISLFVLGGDFWDKLRSLFLHDAAALIPERPAAPGSAR
jgi:hypothetical protein